MLTCRAGCSTDDVIAALGISWPDLFADATSGAATPRQIADSYPYVDESGKLLFECVRFSPKGFAQRRPDGNGGWVWNLNGTRRVLYRLPQLCDATKAGGTVYLVEGEKDVSAIERLGLTATCNPMGAGKWRDEYAQQLRGASVVVVADDDDPGRKHAHQAATSLTAAGIDTKLVELWPRANSYRDAADWAAVARSSAEREQAKALLADIVERTPPFTPATATTDTMPAIRVVSARDICLLPDPPETDELLGPLCRRGQRLLIGADTGHGKTTAMCQAIKAVLYGETFLDWTGVGGDGKALVIDAEQGIRTIKKRLRETGLDASERVDYIRVPDGLALDSDEQEIAEIEAVIAAGGYSFVGADPLYKLHRGESNDERPMVDLMRRFDRWRERYEFHLWIGTHVRKPIGAKFSIHDIFGSSAVVRGAKVVLGLQRLSNGYAKLHFFKDRDGDLPPAFTKWALTFDREHLFRRDPKDEKPSTKEQVAALRVADPEMTQAKAADLIGVSTRTVRKYWGEDNEDDGGDAQELFGDDA